MIRHFFLDKTATIIKGSKANTGLNPVLALTYGVTVSRGLVHFDENEINNWIKTEGFSDTSKLSYTLKMTNCLSVDGKSISDDIVSCPGSISDRASSFDIELFKLDTSFDAGRGYDYESDFIITGCKSYSESGANWYNARNGKEWTVNGAFNGDIIGTQHFDVGYGNISFDITDYVNNILSGNEENNGLGLKFSEDIEHTVLEKQQYVGFFTNNTNTFFHPYIEVLYDDKISDDRGAFYNNKENRLYLYTFIDGEGVKLDKLPTCTIDNKTYDVTCQMKGVYYATVKNDFGDGLQLKYDNWSNLYYDGNKLDDIELEFTVNPYNRYLNIGDKSAFKDMTVPAVYGIDDEEDLSRGEIREVVVDFRKKYTTDIKLLNNSSEYRLYIKDAHKEIDIFDYQPIEKAFLNNYFVINTNDLIPGKYYVDIRVRQGRELRYYKDVLHFNVKSNITEKYY